MSSTAYTRAAWRRPTILPAERVHALETLFATILLGWVLVGTAFPDQVFRTMAGTLPAFGAIFALSGLALLRGGLRLRCHGPDIALLFLMIAGLTSLALSWLDFPALAAFPRDDRFILRQAYFLALLPLGVIAGQVLWRRFHDTLATFCVRHFVPLALMIMIGDWSTGYLLGTPGFEEFNDYNLYLEKGTIWLIFGYVYLARVMLGRGSPWLPFALLCTYFFGSLAIGYGSLFQATTGAISFAVLAAATLLCRNLNLAGLAAMGIFAALALLLAAGTIHPDLLKEDYNAWWRFTGWQYNFAALWESGMLGIGFGTPYRPVAAENLEHAMRVTQAAREAWTAGAQPYDLIYMRTQHNSFVNLFFRTGLLGGMAFLLFNIGLLAAGLRAIASGDPLTRAHVAMAMFVFVLGAVEIALHVGLETPRFLIAYTLAASLLSALLYGRRG
ncbi:MAG: hypothetical protein AB7U38_01725 [Hyphomicrobiales bacterium]